MIIKTAKSFFHKIGFIFLAYIAILLIIYPLFVNNSFGTIYTTTLLLIISISILARYFLGLTYKLLIQADQKGFISNIIEAIIIIINSIGVVVLIKSGVSIHLVKLWSAIIFSLSAIVYYVYVKKHYPLEKDCAVDNDLIKDRWSAFGHHIAASIHFNTDPVILTIFSTVKEVSVYSVYAMIVSGVRGMIANLPMSLSATFGNMIANGEEDSLKKKYTAFDYLNLIVVAIAYTATIILIIPFVRLYTNEVADADYIRPFFAILIVIAEAFYNIQMSYSTIVWAAGHFRQTRRDSYLEAIINVVVSLVLVRKLGLSGVAIGTICGMGYRMITYAIYLSKNIVCWSFRDVLRRYVITLYAVIVSYFVVIRFISYHVVDYVSWIIYAIIVTIAVTIISILTHTLLNYSETKRVYQIFFQPIFNKIRKKA